MKAVLNNYLRPNESLYKKGSYKNYTYFITIPKDKLSSNPTIKAYRDYVIIKPNQHGYLCKANELENNDPFIYITSDKKDTHGIRVIGFFALNKKPWTSKGIISECKFAINTLSIYDKGIISSEVAKLLQYIRQDMEINDLAVESFKQIDSILNTEQSHNAVKAIKKAQVKDTDKNIKNAFNILNKALFQAHINVFDCAYDYWN